jgi:hypothetical protein
MALQNALPEEHPIAGYIQELAQVQLLLLLMLLLLLSFLLLMLMLKLILY